MRHGAGKFTLRVVETRRCIAQLLRQYPSGIRIEYSLVRLGKRTSDKGRNRLEHEQSP
jgi:hypothetical protein